MEFLVVTGVSGGGKGQALKHLEDMGYFCVDNMPPKLIPTFAELCANGDWVEKAAVVLDIRSRVFRDELEDCLNNIKDAGVNYHVLFMEASNEELINRFKQNRRMHPLSTSGERLQEAIDEERKFLKLIKENADYVIDTTNLKLSELKDKIANVLNEQSSLDELTINVVSFGFKYGAPNDCDLMFDVRFIPNPFYFANLKHQSGLDQDVIDFVIGNDTTKEFFEKLYPLLDFLIPSYIRERKAQLVIGIGCTGGRHRSTAIAQQIYDDLSKKYSRVTIEHRDIEKDGRVK